MNINTIKGGSYPNYILWRIFIEPTTTKIALQTDGIDRTSEIRWTSIWTWIPRYFILEWFLWWTIGFHEDRPFPFCCKNNHISSFPFKRSRRHTTQGGYPNTKESCITHHHNLTRYVVHAYHSTSGCCDQLRLLIVNTVKKTSGSYHKHTK